MAAKKKLLSARSKWMLWLLTPCIAVAGTGYYLVGTTSGMRWMAGVVDRHTRGAVKVDGLSGSLLNGFDFEKIAYNAKGQRIDVQAGHLAWQPRALLSKELHLLQLSVEKIDIHNPQSTTPNTPVVLPDSLQLPLSVSAEKIHVGTLRIFNAGSSKPDVVVSDIDAALHSDAAQHQLHLQHAHLPAGMASAEVTLATVKPYALAAQVILDTTTPRAEALRVQADAKGDLQRIHALLKAEGAGLNANGEADLAPLGDIPLQHIQVQFHGVDSARLVADVQRANLSGKIDLRGKPQGVLEGTVKMHNEAAQSLDKRGVPIVAVSALVHVSADHWQIHQLDAQNLLAGNLTGDLDWDAKKQAGSAQLNLHNVDVQAFDSQLESRRMNGSVNVDGAGQSQHAMLVLADGASKLTGDVTRQGRVVTLNSVRLTRGETSLDGHGEFIMDARRSFKFFSQLRKLNLAEFSATPATELNAELSVSGELLPEAHGELLINLGGSHFAQYDIGGKGHVNYAGGQRGEGQMEIHLGDNQVSAVGSYGMGKDELHIDLAAANLTQIDKDLAGSLTGRATLSGSVGAPQLTFNINGKSLQLPAAQRVDTLETSGEVSAQVVNIKVLMRDFQDANKLRIPVAELDVQGAPEKHTVSAHAKVVQGEAVQEEVQLRASGGVGETDKGWRALQWQGTLDEFVGHGSLPVQLHAPATLQLSAQNIQLGVADIALAGGQAHLTATQTTPEYWQSMGTFTGLGVRAVNVAQDNPTLNAFDTLRFGGNWNVKMDTHLNALLQVQRESGDWIVDPKTGARFGLADLKLSVRAEQNQLHSEMIASGEKLGDFKVQANMPMTQVGKSWTVTTDAPLTGRVYLNTPDLGWLGPAIDSNFQSGGKLKLEADIIGNLHTPRLRGSVQGEGVSFAMLDQGVRLEHGQISARLEQDAVQLDRFDFDSPYLPQPKDKLLGDFKLTRSEGKLSANGMLDLKGDAGGVQISAQQFPLLQRLDRWVIASGTGHARFAGKTLILDGNIRADAGLIDQPVSNRPQLAEDVQIAGQEVDERSKQQNKVTAQLELGDHFYIRAAGLEARLAGKLDVRGEPGEPLSVTGIIDAQEAVFDAYGQRLQVDRGMVNFQGRMDDPGLNILATRKGLSVEAGVEVTGTARKPVIHLVSTPNVPDAEKLSWVVLGRVPDSSGIDSSLLLSAASNILGGQSALHLGRALGVDELSLNQKAGGDVSNQVVTVGKRLNSRAYISYEQGLSATSGITKFTYTLTPRVTLVTRTGVEDALDLFYSFRYY